VYHQKTVDFEKNRRHSYFGFTYGENFEVQIAVFSQ